MPVYLYPDIQLINCTLCKILVRCFLGVDKTYQGNRCQGLPFPPPPSTSHIEIHSLQQLDFLLEGGGPTDVEALLEGREGVEMGQSV